MTAQATDPTVGLQDLGISAPVNASAVSKYRLVIPITGSGNIILNDLSDKEVENFMASLNDSTMFMQIQESTLGEPLKVAIVQKVQIGRITLSSM